MAQYKGPGLVPSPHMVGSQTCLMPSSDFQRHQVSIWHIYVCARKNTQTHKNQIWTCACEHRCPWWPQVPTEVTGILRKSRKCPYLEPSLQHTYFHSLKSFIIILCVRVLCLVVCLGTVCMPSALGVLIGGQKDISDAPELDLQMVGSQHVGAGNRTRVLWKKSQHF